MGFNLAKSLGFKNPSKEAQPYLNQIGPMSQQAYNPYIQQGQQAGNNVAGQYQQLTNNPTGFLESLMADYNPSTGFKRRKDEALQALTNSAAAGGYAGSEADQQRHAELASSLASDDMYNWLDRVLGIHGTGLQGQENLSNRGYNATQSLNDIMGNTYNQQAGLAFQGANQRNSNLFGFADILAQLGGAALGKPSMPGQTGGNTGGGESGGNMAPYRQPYQPAPLNNQGYMPGSWIY